MSYSGDAAEQVVRLTLNGAEVAAKITGAGAKELALLLYAIMKEQKKTKGKISLSNMIKSGKELKVFAIKDDELQRFCTEAKKYGVLYCVLRDKNATDGVVDVMVKAEDASKINRIFERFQLSTVDVGAIKTDIARNKTESIQQMAEEETEKTAAQNAPLNQRANPTSADRRRSPRSELISELKEAEEASKKPSVRKELRKIQAEKAASAAAKSRQRGRAMQVPGKER